MSSATPEFLFVRPRDYVAIKKENCDDTKGKDENYWVGQVIDCIGGARNPNSWTKILIPTQLSSSNSNSNNLIQTAKLILLRARDFTLR